MPRRVAIGAENVSGMVPESCTDCTSNGHITRLIEWQLAQDANVTMSGLSYSQDLPREVRDFCVDLLCVFPQTRTRSISFRGTVPFCEGLVLGVR